MGHEYVMTLTDEERQMHEDANGINDFHDLVFKGRVLVSVVSLDPSGPDSDAEVHLRSDGFTYDEPTDEGYRHAEVTWCEDECDQNASSQRDVYAEMMGY